MVFLKKSEVFFSSIKVVMDKWNKTTNEQHENKANKTFVLYHTVKILQQ